MRIMASILLMYFTYLAAQPVMPLVKKALEGEEKCTMSCCHKATKKPNPKQEANNCCKGDLCNPFGQYACCIGYVVEKSSYHIMIPPKREAIVNRNGIVVVPGFCSDCWRPPEIAVC